MWFGYHSETNLRPFKRQPYFFEVISISYRRRLFLDTNFKFCGTVYVSFVAQIEEILELTRKRLEVKSWIVLDYFTDSRKSFHIICHFFMFDSVRDCGQKLKEIKMAGAIDHDVLTIIDFSSYKNTNNFDPFDTPNLVRIIIPYCTL